MVITAPIIMMITTSPSCLSHFTAGVTTIIAAGMAATDGMAAGIVTAGAGVAGMAVAVGMVAGAGTDGIASRISLITEHATDMQNGAFRRRFLRD
ncbi:hypothetical protein A6U86_14675 [Rhizobium sp. AC27/96]|nr:hypothetical protein A6U86_14675 [Rhizobium sp. AC27/96]